MTTDNPFKAAWELRDRLVSTSAGIVCDNLALFGNRLSVQHRDALELLAQGFADLALKHTTGRLAYPLPTGTGKTQSIVAFCAALHKLGVTDVSVAVAASKVEALCTLKRDLMRNGVPEEKIGLMHSYKYDPKVLTTDGKLKENTPDSHASLPATDGDAMQHKQFALVTHNRIKGAGSLLHYLYFRGVRRSLVIWDEALLVSDAVTLPLGDLARELAAAVGYTTALGEQTPEVLQFVAPIVAALLREVDAQKDGAAPSLIRAAQPVSEDTFEDHRRHLRVIAKSDKRRPLGVENLLAFLDISMEPLRATRVPAGELRGVVSYEMSIPEELTSVAILDASFPIRELERADSTIKQGVLFFPELKRYDNVRFHHYAAPGGRKSLTTNFKKYSDEAVTIVTSRVKPEDGVLFFTFKANGGRNSRGRKVDFTKDLKAALRDASVDLHVNDHRN